MFLSVHWEVHPVCLVPKVSSHEKVSVHRSRPMTGSGVSEEAADSISLCSSWQIQQHIPRRDPSTSNPAETRTLPTVSTMASALWLKPWPDPINTVGKSLRRLTLRVGPQRGLETEISAELEKHNVIHIVWCWNGRINSLNRGRTRLVSLVFEGDKTEFKQTQLEFYLLK